MRRKEVRTQQQELEEAKQAYQVAKQEGNLQEEARWANFVGNIHKTRGEYNEALRWLRRDYDVTSKYLPINQLLATCQSLGEIFFLLHEYEDALIYQKKHLEIAKDANDLVEQQRANTQLGRTYHDIFTDSDDDHSALRNAKKYFKSAMKLAQTIKDNLHSRKGSFTKEYIDAHNNIGMLEIDLDNYKEAENILKKGLHICDEEEVQEDDDARSRLHHNLGRVYLALSEWKFAEKHIKKDITICNRINHQQGEAKGYINLGVLHYNRQMYDEAISYYQKAFQIAKSLEDEDMLIDQISQNIESAREAVKVMDEVKKEEMNFKKLERNTIKAKGTDTERKYLLKQYESINCLIEKATNINAWTKLCDYAIKKMRIAIELSDKEKEGDSYLNVGESYLKILNLKEALKWGRKSWETFDSIGNLEGKAHAKLNIGEVLDSSGDFEGALDAFNEGYRFALEANKSSTQLDALELIHYSYMIRFDDFEKAKETKLLIEQLKQSISEEVNAKDHLGDGPDGCSETKTGLDTQSTDESSDGSFSPNTNKVNFLKSKFKDSVDDWNENIPLRSLIQSNKKKEKQRTAASPRKCIYPSQSSSDHAGRLAVSRKRVRIILSDDEAEDERDYRSSHGARNHTMEGIATSDESTRRYRSCPVPEVQDVSPVASSCAPVNLEKNTSPSKSRSSKLGSQDAKSVDNFNTHAGSCNPSYSEICTLDVHSCFAEPCQHTIFKIDEKLLHVDLDLSTACGKLSMDQMKVELACLYYLQFSREKRSRGLVPVVQHMKYSGRFLESMEALYSIREYVTEKNWIEVSVGAMVSKPVIKLYIDFCEALAEPPNLKVVKTLYNLEVSDDKIIVPDCELRDVSAAPLLNALQLHSMTTVLDLSHNLLGNGTMEKLKQVFVSPGQSHLGLILNFHHNQLGPAALYHICDCPVLYARLEVLNISGNSLTDACASSMSTILQTCKALYSLDIENCSISSRTVQKVADSLHSESVLTHLYLGYNNPVSGNAMISLLRKLATLNGFQELSLSGIKLSKPVVNNLCQFAKDCCLSGLMLGNTNIGMESAIQLIKPLSKDTQELCRLDLSFCGLTRDYIFSLSNEVQLISGILELNLGGNSITEEGSIQLASLLSNPLSCLRVLVVKKCSLGLMGIIRILQALSSNCHLEELNLAENVKSSEIETLVGGSDPMAQISGKQSENDVEVAADSEDELEGVEICLSEKKSRLTELSNSIIVARELKVLDLSQNGFSKEVTEILFTAWSSGARAGLVCKHVEENTVHLSVKGKMCCGIKPCCRKM